MRRRHGQLGLVFYEGHDAGHFADHVDEVGPGGHHDLGIMFQGGFHGLQFAEQLGVADKGFLRGLIHEPDGLGITFRGEQPNDEQVKLAKTNDILAKMDDGKHVFFMNINKIYLRPDGTIPKSLMPDCEHPNKEGCRVWAEAIEPKVAELLGEKPIKPESEAPKWRPSCRPQH